MIIIYPQKVLKNATFSGSKVNFNPNCVAQIMNFSKARYHFSHNFRLFSGLMASHIFVLFIGFSNFHSECSSMLMVWQLLSTLAWGHCESCCLAASSSSLAKERTINVNWTSWCVFTGYFPVAYSCFHFLRCRKSHGSLIGYRGSVFRCPKGFAL